MSRIRSRKKCAGFSQEKKIFRIRNPEKTLPGYRYGSRSQKVPDPGSGTEHQCCGSELFFTDSDPQFFSDSDGFGSLRLTFWPQIFLNGAYNCFHMCSGTCTSERKMLNGKTRFFSFKCLIFDFSQKFSFYNSVWIRVWIRIRIWIRTFFRIRIQPKHLDSFGFGFGSTTLLNTLYSNI
jgi:hypothetical protein